MTASLEDSLEEIAFLARSENRVQVLESLARGVQSQRELRDDLAVPRATMARTLTELENRNWIVRTGDRYDITDLGELVVEEFLPLVDLMASVQRLGDVFHLLPTDEMEVDLRSFASAEVLVPDEMAPTKHLDRGLDLVRSVDSVRVLAWTALPAYVSIVRDRLIAEEIRFESIVAEAFLADLAEHPSVHADFRDILDAGGEIYRYDDQVPYNLLIADDTVFFWLCNSDGTEQAALVCTDASVRSWAVETYEAYRALADPIDIGNALSP